MAAMQSLTCQAWLLGTLAFSAGPLPQAVAEPVNFGPGNTPPASSVQATANELLLAQNTTINRNVPVDLPVALPTFSGSPTEAEISAKGGLQEPLVPVSDAKPAAVENKALAAALLAYRATKSENPEDVSALTGFLASYPNSPWRAALLTNLGLIYRQTGYFSRALNAWEEALTLAGNAKQDGTSELADRALSELAELNSRLGRQDRLKTLLVQAEHRQAKGSVANRIDGAKTGLAMMQHQPGTSFKCGPYALERILASQGGLDAPKTQIVHDAQSTSQGTSLPQVAQLSHMLGMDYQMAKRQPGSAVIVPAVINWKAGHYAALVRQLGNGKYWVEDPTFGKGMQVSQAALDEEGSGYFLVPAQQTLPSGWKSLTEQEGQTVWGKGTVTGRDDPGCGDNESGGNGPSCAGCGEGPGIGAPNIAMPGYNVYTTAVSLHITDTPVGYNPPVGPSVYNTVAYNQYEANQLAGFQYSNFGPLWNSSWSSYIVVDPGSQNAYVHTPGGGTTTFSYSTFNQSTSTYGANQRGQSTLHKISATNYIQSFTDGSKAVYSVPDASGNIFYKQSIDSKGNAITLHYEIESNPTASYPMRLACVSDAIGQVTIFDYTLQADLYKITKITDPFGRFASFGYSQVGNSYQLTSITDVIGMTSTFGYEGSNVDSLTTPYGTTTFTFSSSPSDSTVRTLEVTDPYGAKERWENWINTSPTNNSEQVAPTGMNVTNTYLVYRNTFYWDKKALVDDPSHSYQNATIYHWLHTPGGLASHTLESIKKPLENRVWFNYPGQSSSILEGTSDRPSAVGRVLDDGTTQLYILQYSSDNSQLIKEIDPKGRMVYFDYDTNGIDLLMIRQATGSSTSVVLQKRVYDSTFPPHCPKQIIDASGQVTAYTYDPQGRVLTIINPKGEQITNSYTRPPNNPNAGPADGYLYSNTGAVANATTSYTYDALGREKTITDSEGYKTTYDYDALDRITKTDYPDSTFTQSIYNRLDVEWSCDRLGRWSHQFHDALRHLVAKQDPLGHTTNFGYCLCGALTSETDPAGNTTQWAQDIQGRQISKTYADGKQTIYAYEHSTSRLKSATDAMSQVTNFAYDVDDKLKQISYTATHATSTVNYTFDSTFDRPGTLADDGTGAITYSYGPYLPFAASSFTSAAYNAWPGIPTTGAGRLISEAKAGTSGMISYTITYGYDELGRQTSRNIDGTNNSATVGYDALGRTTNITNLLGSFGFNYTTPTSEQVSLVYLGNQNGLRTSFGYDTNLHSDRRLLTINSLTSLGATITHFDYSYDAEGNIITWTQQVGNQTAQQFNLGYDAANQLTSALLTDTTPAHALLKTNTYGYDLAANRTSEQADQVVNKAIINNLNQISSTGAGGLMRFAGTLSEPASVTVGGNAAQVEGTNFAGYANVTGGTNTVVVTATNRSGVATTNNYQVQVNSAGAQILSYDKNGNLTNDGVSKSYEWDAANRMTAINYSVSGDRTEFTYDGVSRLVAITEKSSGAVTSTKLFVWCGDNLQPSEERDVNNNVTRRFFNQGEQIAGQSYYYNRDHLGNVRALIDNTQTIRANYNYGLYGARSANLIAVNPVEASFGFAGYYFHPTSALHLTKYRAYSGVAGRWLNRDPLENAELLPEGPNIYSYVANNPANQVDPEGLFLFPVAPPPVVGPPPVLAGAVCFGVGVCIGYPIGRAIGRCIENAPRWTCTAKGAEYSTETGEGTGRWLTGSGSGSSEAAACLAAKKDLNDNVRRGFRPKHVQCNCSKG